MINFKTLVILSLFIPVIGFSQQKQGALIQQLANQGALKMEIKQDTIPIKIWNNEILLKVKVNGDEGYFIWDNGFSFSAINESYASQLHLKDIEKINHVETIDGVNNKLNLNIKLANTIQVGKATIANSPVLLTELGALLNPGQNIKGVFGATDIKKLNWKFNFDENYVVISKKSFEGEGIKIGFDLSPYNLMYTAFGVNGHLDQALVDFGYNGDDVLITMQAAPLFAQSKKNIIKGQTSLSVSGFDKADTSFRVKDFDYIIGDTLTTVPHKFKIHVSNSEKSLLIGNRFFRHYNCIVNMSTKTFILSKRKTPIDAMPEKSYGFTFIKLNNELRVINLSDNPNATKYSDLKPQDTIVAINGKKASDFNDNASLTAFQTNALRNNEKLVIKRNDGKTFELTPENDIYK